MSNPLERLRQQREAVWEKQRAKEETKRPKLSLGSVEEQLVAEQALRAEEARRANNGVPLATIQRDVVAYLRGARRAVTLEELSVHARFDVSSSTELLASLDQHVRIRKQPNGLYRYKPRYDVSNVEEMVRLIEGNEGVIVAELRESYHEAARDIEAIKKAGRVFALPNKVLGSEILFGCYSKYDLDMPSTLKDAWHSVAIPDPKKLEAQLKQLNLPVAVAPAAANPKIRRKRQKKVVAKGPGRVKVPRFESVFFSCHLFFAIGPLQRPRACRISKRQLERHTVGGSANVRQERLGKRRNLQSCARLSK